MLPLILCLSLSPYFRILMEANDGYMYWYDLDEALATGIVAIA